MTTTLILGGTGKTGRRVARRLTARGSETVGAFADLAVASGARRLVLLSGRGEDGAQRGEQAVRDAGADWWDR